MKDPCFLALKTCLCAPEGADVAAVGRGRAAGSAAHLQQRGGGEGAVPHARGQSTPRFLVFTTKFLSHCFHWIMKKKHTRK